MNELRQNLRLIYDVCEQADADNVSVDFAGTSLSVRQLFEIEVTAFLLYLTASDRIIAQEEIDFINELMGRSYSLDECTEAIEKYRLLDEGFDSTTPLSFRLLIDYTRAHGNDISDALISFFDVLGACIASIDSEYTGIEDEARRRYVHLLRGYKALKES